MTSQEPKDVCAEKEFERQFKSVAPLLRNFLIFKFKDEFSAEDMVQEAFSVLWQNCKKVIPSHAKAFVFKVAQNQFMTKFKKEKTAQNHIHFVVNNSKSEDPSFVMEYNEFESSIQDSINKLPDGQREVFLLNRIEKKTYNEIAELLEVSVKAIEKRMHKALIELRKISKNI